MTLSDVQRTAGDFAHEFERAHALGAVPPSPDEVLSFIEDVEACDNDSCDRCDAVTQSARAFELEMVNGEAGDAGRALAHLLVDTGAFTRSDARTVVAQFCALIVRDAQPPEIPAVIPPCAAAMGCLCAGHARGNDADAACDTNE